MRMQEGLPPNNAAHMLRVPCDAGQAHAIVDAIMELFDMAEAAAAAFELEPNTKDWRSGEWIVEAYFSDPPDEATIRSIVKNAAGEEAAAAATFSLVREQEWLDKALEGLEPVEAGRFIVHTSRDREKARALPGRIAIEIDAAQAFGTGHHGTTRGCLLMLDAILKRHRPRNIVDVGTGTGVLAIAAALALRQPVGCGDNDPVAVATACENARINNAAQWLKPVISDGLRHHDLRLNGPYDLIFANILARPLRALAPSIRAASHGTTDLVLSGLLAPDVAGVVSAYRTQGFALVRRIDLEGWATLLMRPGGTTRARLGYPPEQE